MNPNSSNICIRYSVWVIEEKYTHNLPIYLLYIIYNKIGANWCINPKRVKLPEHECSAGKTELEMMVVGTRA